MLALGDANDAMENMNILTNTVNVIKKNFCFILILPQYMVINIF